MDGTDPALWPGSSLPWILIAQALLLLLAGSCAIELVGGSPTPAALPSIRRMTPVLAPTEPATATVVPQASPTPTDVPLEPAGPTAHVVEPGDTLLGLAREYGVPMAAIQMQNDMGESTTIQAGETLSIASGQDWENASPFWVVHEVNQGETLIGIAQAQDLAVERLQTVNSLDDANRIVVGQMLILPLTGPAATRTAAPQDTLVPTVTPVPTHTPMPTLAPTPANSPLPTPSPQTGGAPGEAAPVPSEDLAAWPPTIATLINGVRAQHGLEPLRYSQMLEEAAQLHAGDCSQRGWCSHTGSDGADAKARIARTGYDGSGWAECWAQTQSPQRAVEVWMDETPPNDPHRRTLLSDWLSEIGIGVAEAEWGTYIIADFGRP